MNKQEIWLEVSFDGQPMDNIIAHSEQEAKDLIESVEELGFTEYNDEVKEDWLGMGFRDNPIVTVCIAE